MIGSENVKVYLFVATLGYSRQLYVRPLCNEPQATWFASLQGIFRHFGGVTAEVLLDHDSAGRSPPQIIIMTASITATPIR
jgi:transposase